MATRQPGLRKRMQLEARRIFHQHEQLNELHVLAAKSLEGSDRDAARGAREAMGHFADALRAHFEIEEKTHFPALHGLSPATDERLAQLVHEHVEFRGVLGNIEEALRVPDLAAARRLRESLARGLAAHEKLEEELFRETTT